MKAVIGAGKHTYTMLYTINCLILLPGENLFLNRDFSDAEPVPGTVSVWSHLV